MNAFVSHDFVGAQASAMSVGPPPGMSQILPQLTQELEQILREEREFSRVAQRCLELMRRWIPDCFATILRATTDQGVQTLDAIGGVPESPQDEVKNALREAVETCFQRRVAVGRPLAATRDLAVLSVPLQAPGSPPTAIALIARLKGWDLARLASLVDYVAAALSQALAADVVRHLDWEVRTTAAAMELVNKIQACQTLEQAAVIVVQELKSFCQCGLVVLGLCSNKESGTRVAAISGLSEFDPASESVTLYRNALDESMIRQEPSLWPPRQSDERHALLAHRKLTEHTREEATLSMPLTTPEGEVVGAILAQGPAAIIQQVALRQTWQAMQPHLAIALRARQQAEPSRFTRWWRRILGNRTRVSTRKLILGISTGAIVLSLLPVPHQIRCDCDVEPTIRRYVVAPYDGRLAECLVKPGDQVQEGQVLARMDDREIRWELTGLTAERARAAKERDAHRVDRDNSGAQIAELEMERLDVKIRLLQGRAENLEITAPLSGLVLRGDLQDAEGAPVEVGTTLFEIAPLEPVKLQLAVPESDVSWVAPGMRVTAHLEGYPRGSIRGAIEMLHPRAELREDKNVFIAELSLANPTGQLRPGMRGTARISAGRKPLAWVWLHKAWFRVRVFTGW